MDYQYDVSFTNLLMSDDNVYDEVGDDNPDVLTQIPNENVVAPTLKKAQRTKNFTVRVAQHKQRCSNWE